MPGANEYKAQLQALLPSGRLWDALREGGSLADQLLAALAGEFARVDERGEALLDETDPRTVYELLAEWEAFAGLPDSCTGELSTISQRREALLERLTSTGGQSAAYFIALAERLGYTVTITEYTPPYVGQAVAGDALTYGGWVHAFGVNAPETTISDAVAGSAAAGEPLRSWGNAVLECAIRRRKPAHSVVLFTYGG